MAASVLSAGFSSYSYSDVITGRTNNAASTGYTWNMDNVLPPQAGLTIGGVIHRYTIDKNAEDNATVTIQNENAIDGGYIYQLQDNWDGLPGSSKLGYERLPEYIPREYFGQGELIVDGNATVADAYVAYDYVYDECYVPLTDPSCPGYLDALYKYLLDNGLLNGDNFDDPYYNEWVQAELNKKTEVDEEENTEEIVEEENTEEESIEDKLAIAGAAEKLADAAQQQSMLEALANLPKFDPYYTVTIEGGTYEETIKLQDKELPDNRRALRSLSSDENHRSMIRMQYDNPTMEN